MNFANAVASVADAEAVGVAKMGAEAAGFVPGMIPSRPQILGPGYGGGGADTAARGGGSGPISPLLSHISQVSGTSGAEAVGFYPRKNV